MNERMNENLERRVNRLLDGELTDEQRADLQRELLRDPAAHRLMAQYARQDDLCRRALDSALGAGARARSTFAAGAKARPARWLASAAAAAVLLAVGLWFAHHAGPADNPPRPRAAGGVDPGPATTPRDVLGIDDWVPVRAPDTPMQRIRTFDRFPVTVYDKQRNELRIFYVDRGRARICSASKDL